ncbi:hypothetical protein DWB68_00605 [Galactobacter valiniphilus]|uniref:DUF4064 domain-containing protein n=1 Tax=Galactobacter valiniphilus TaxID=2676122 RepID=A0A399JMD0_9MICC|nr:hypothetical protein [Galactobacter valiniphilus]RII43766.1 hypothetical protein DWB68_00605 [Galactobacter valiniphilus]
MSTPPTDPTPGQDPQQPSGEEPPRYGVRLPGYGQNAAPQGSAPVPENNERPGWDASPHAAPGAAGTPGTPGAQPGGYGQVPPAPQYGQPAQGGFTLPPAPADPYAQGIPVQPSGVYGNYQQPGFGAPAGQMPPRPSTARWASLLLAIGAVAYLITAAIQMMTIDAATLREAALAAVPAEMQSQYESIFTEEMINSTKVTAVVLIAIISALAGLVAWLTYRGQNAWRIVGTVCGAVAVLGNITGGPIGLLFAALAVAIIVLWWMRPSSQWFGAISQAKRQGQRF